MRYAGVSHRFVAVLIDGVAFVALVFAIGLLTGGVSSNRSNGSYQLGIEGGDRAALLLLGIFFAYYVICEAIFGRTIGKRLVGLRVVDGAGQHIGLGASFVRNLLRLVDGLFFYFVAAARSGPRPGDNGSVIVSRTRSSSATGEGIRLLSRRSASRPGTSRTG